jgi:hypothetical protein
VDGKSVVLIKSVDPGLCNSEMARESPFSVHLLMFLLAQTCEEGSKNYIVVASLGREGNGKYTSDSRIEGLAISDQVCVASCSADGVAQRIIFRQQ